MSAAVKDAVTPALLREVRDFWFEHLTDPKALILPTFADNKRWFMGGPALDEACTTRFAPTLEAIRSAGVTSGQQLLVGMGGAPTDPRDWMSLLILLDQIPRNCYRGDAAGVVFGVFDPVARDVALAAIAAGVPDGAPLIRWQFAYRNWFYMPLMHSEDLATHDRALVEYERMLADVRALAEGEGEARDEHEARAREVVRADVDAANKLAGLNLEFERKHYDIIKRFGRYPHRNKALGRQATKEEEEYLANGGETFSQ
ncbi:delta(14)-sterol reductase [Purpureocillium lavendulum]|uniref:Delta(14)-sterol reductase n=1 Tax=Purpureocillium lavendulum TaxID=1247861 RepID=A0AB34G9G3_9HYPO|nr:delta(14)-sterol reductase [Purpureocillium lavendulum]